MILLVSTGQDEHARAVGERLGDRARLLDLSAFPRELSLSVAYDGDAAAPAMRAALGGLPLSEVGVVWWRRPQPFGLHPDLSGRVDRSFAYAECRSALDGLWLALDADWVNHPTRDDEAARKVYQLRVAREVGFAVPETLVTTDPGAARAFVDDHGPESTAYKAFSATEEAWRETRVLRPGETDHLDAVRHAPVIFQEYVPAGVDLRVTVMGESVFPAAIHVGETEYEVDYRMALDRARVEPHDLPPAVASLVRSYVDELGLTYGAIDLRRRPDGEYVFLEINPSGQWLFVERRTGRPMTETFAGLLARMDGE